MSASAKKTKRPIDVCELVRICKTSECPEKILQWIPSKANINQVIIKLKKLKTDPYLRKEISKTLSSSGIEIKSILVELFMILFVSPATLVCAFGGDTNRAHHEIFPGLLLGDATVAANMTKLKKLKVYFYMAIWFIWFVNLPHSSFVIDALMNYFSGYSRG